MNGLRLHAASIGWQTAATAASSRCLGSVDLYAFDRLQIRQCIPESLGRHVDLQGLGGALADAVSTAQKNSSCPAFKSITPHTNG